MATFEEKAHWSSGVVAGEGRRLPASPTMMEAMAASTTFVPNLRCHQRDRVASRNQWNQPMTH
jgi:hypothetical protein